MPRCSRTWSSRPSTRPSIGRVRWRRRRCRRSPPAWACRPGFSRLRLEPGPPGVLAVQLPEPLERLISELSRLPGIGPKTAQRLAFHLLRADRERVERLAEVLVELKSRLGYCSRCFNIAEGPLCVVCASGPRDETASRRL